MPAENKMPMRPDEKKMASHIARLKMAGHGYPHMTKGRGRSGR